MSEQEDNELNIEDDPLIRELRATQAAIQAESEERKEAIAKESTQRKKSGKRNLLGAIAGILGAAVAVWLSISAIATANRVEEVSKAGQDRSLGNLVAVCAIGNVMRIDMQNMVTDMETTSVLQGPEAGTFIEAQRSRFQQVDCKAFVPKEDQVKIELKYPPVNKPGSPVTTVPDSARG